MDARRLFEGLVWPAVAGNVAWAFLTVLLKTEIGEKPLLAGEKICLLASLAMAAVFLFMDWSRLQGKKPDKPKVYWWADGFYAISISVFAISVIEKPNWIFLTLALPFIVSFCGNCCNAWEHGTNKSYWLVLANGGALSVLAVGYFFAEESIIFLPVAIFIPFTVSCIKDR